MITGEERERVRSLTALSVKYKTLNIYRTSIQSIRKHFLGLVGHRHSSGLGVMEDAILILGLLAVQGGTVSTSCKGLLPILGRSKSSKSATICKSGEELCLEVASEASQKEQGLKQCLDCSEMLGLLHCTSTELGITL